MNIVFMGTPDFAVESLMKIYEAGHNILAVVSQPDRPSGRGMKLVPTPVKEYALSKEIKVYQPEKIKNNEQFINEIKNLKPDVIVVVAYGKILPIDILSIPKYGCINVHGSLLPKYRGAAPIQWAIINGEEKTGITTMYMSEGMDTGDMILKQEVVIDYSDTYGTLYDKLKKVGGSLILETLEKVADGIVKREKQPNDFSIAPMIEKSMGNINWNKSAIEIRNLIRGLNPMPGAYTFLNNNEKIKIWSADVVQDIDGNGAVSGTVIKSNSTEGLFVSTGEGIIKIVELQMPNNKKMLATDYLRGHVIEEGAIFTN